MGLKDSRKTLAMAAFACVVLVSATTAALSVYNILKSSEYPDFGFGYLFVSGYRVVANITEPGHAGGIQDGDYILEVNGRTFSSYDEFQEARNQKIGGSNTYLVKRGGNEVEITIWTTPRGYRFVLGKNLPSSLLGMFVMAVGILVFLMKPYHRVSWIFLLFMCTTGILTLFLYRPPQLLIPKCLEFMHIFSFAFTPAGFFHLALGFPEETTLLRRYPKVQLVPYVISAVLFTYILSKADTLIRAPHWCMTAIALYMAAGVLFFLACCLKGGFKSPSQIVRLRSKVMLIGFGVCTLPPLVNFVLGAVSNIRILPTSDYNAIFFIAFPISVGYSIVKHDLFGFDTIIKRTYGYVITTGAVAGSYALFVFITNLLFGHLAIAQSPLFPLSFVLAVIFFFNPIRNRMQRYIDKLFYRLEYDYRETVQKISESMRSLLRLDQISKVMMETVLDVMFVESGCIFVRGEGEGIFRCIRAGGDIFTERDSRKTGQHSAKTGLERTRQITGDFSSQRDGGDGVLPEFSADEPLMAKLAEKKREVTIYDVQEDPDYEESRSECEQVFEKMSATLILPLIYEEQLIGMMPLGRKKSGKTYRREDIILLHTLANQGVVAIKNASLVKEVIEKERMEEELAIARDLQMSMLPATCPEIEGFLLAAHCISAREVGGDFYDFIEMEGGRLGLVLGDVTGKSVSGALVTAASRSILRILSEQEGLGVDQIMVRANRRIKKDIMSGMFVALLLGVIEPGGRTLALSNAGQTQPVIFRSRTGEASLLETEGDTFPLGIIEECDYQETRIDLEPGDKVVFYTDGIVEAMNSEQEIFGFDRLIEIVKESGFMSADQLLGEVLSKVNDFVGGAPQHDDITLITLSVQDEV
ncbi:MAG: SpoIIE family protein phosphatase [Syntrophobacteraceae bacterium]